MGHTLGGGIIVASLAAAVVAYLYFRHIERQRRLEIVHQERLATGRSSALRTVRAIPTANVDVARDHTATGVTKPDATNRTCAGRQLCYSASACWLMYTFWLAERP